MDSNDENSTGRECLLCGAPHWHEGVSECDYFKDDD